MQRGWVVSPYYRAAIAAISAVREERGLSQRELARRIGKPASFVNKIEQLERRLDIEEFIAIAHAMDVPPHELLTAVLGALPPSIRI
ncbi:MAG TPA: helix-turn-helix transcriptional regulator [Allosphingosinicella sp.]|jgi:transcriptional regulator with XRE-family HTH domain